MKKEEKEQALRFLNLFDGCKGHAEALFALLLFLQRFRNDASLGSCLDGCIVRKNLTIGVALSKEFEIFDFSQ